MTVQMAKSLEYLAGLFDGEGSFSIQVSLRRLSRQPDRPSIFINPSMSMSIYYGADVLQLLQERFGGRVRPYAKKRTEHGGRWCLGRVENLTLAARALRPHLVIKQHICDRFLEALSIFPSQAGVDKMNGHRMWTPDLAVRVAEIAFTLNPPRSRKCNKTLEYITEFKRSLETSQQTRHDVYVDRAGEKNGRSKLTLENVAEIRDLYATKEFTQVQLAARFGVTQVAISHVVACKTWNTSAYH